MSWYNIEGLGTIKHDQDPTNDCLYLDAGHGGTDTGCIFYDGTYEKTYVLDIFKRVEKICKPYFSRVYVTRTTDTSVSLETRTKSMKSLASKFKSVQAYSIHCNAYNGISKGAEWLLSISTPKSHSDYIFCTNFLKYYCKEFSLNNRGIVQRRGNNGDYYYLHRNTPSNCKVKFIEMFFGDNRDDCKKGQTEAFKDKASFFLASYILRRYGVILKKPETKPDKLYIVQAGAYTKKENADQQVKALAKKGFDAFVKIEKQ
ncbi:MAG: N-acetylmuramoyl-L-alanine amidase [Candidatus Pacearchaeota archaeon]|jgi:N-acetylmuramoyl-L-alanine amidase